MPSSISNSNSRLPKIDYQKHTLYTIAVFIVLATLTEVALRYRGYMPSVHDSNQRWAMERHLAEDAGDNRVVVLGASRAQLGISPIDFELAVPNYKVVMLAMDSTRPIMSLEDLAERSNFSGIVLLSFTPRLSLIAKTSQEHLINHYHNTYSNYGYINKAANTNIESLLQKNFVIFGVRWPQLLSARLNPPFFRLDYRRWHMADYQSLKKESLEKISARRKIESRRKIDTNIEEHFKSMVIRIEKAVKKIQNKGGQVVLIRMPSSGVFYQTTSEIYPREKYWDKLAKQTGAFTIHFEDVHELQYDTPDLSHLDYRDAKKFSKALAEYLIKVGILEK